MIILEPGEEIWNALLNKLNVVETYASIRVLLVGLSPEEDV